MKSALVVDDSRFMRTVVGSALDDHGYEVGTATDGRQAVDLVRRCEPDVVTMDVEMPEMDGIEAVERIMATTPTPVVMLSAHTDRGADATLRALARGAVDFIPKPAGDADTDVADLLEELTRTVDTAAHADVGAIRRETADAAPSLTAEGPAGETTTGASADADSAVETASANARESVRHTRAVLDGDAPDDRRRPGRETPPTVVVGASTGGPAVVEGLLSTLPVTDARVLLVQHMPESFTGRLAERLDAASAYDVREAVDGGVVGPGEVVVARGDHHLRVATDGDDLRTRLTRDRRVHSVRPAIDVTMESVADTVTGPLVGVVLTGMGRDGADGLRLLNEAGGTTIAQDEETSPVYGMPRAAAEAGGVDRVLPAEEIPEAIRRAVAPEEAHA